MLFTSTGADVTGESYFTNSDFERYVLQKKNAVIYVFSPHMYLSVKGIAEYKKIALSHGFHFLLLRDPNASPQAPYKVKESYHVLASNKLVQLGATQHYPSFLVYTNSKIIGLFNPGYDSPEKFSERLKQLSKK